MGRMRANFLRYAKMALGQKGGQIAIIILAIPLIYLFGFRNMRFFLVPSSSMEPTLLRGDYIVTLDAETYEPGVVVVLRDPEDENGYIVKRVVAAGGDTVAVSDGALFVNGEYISEPYLLDQPNYAFGPITVPPGSVLLLGDNRNNSEDSHLWQQKTQPVESIIGRVRLIYFPYRRAGEVARYRFPTRPLGGQELAKDERVPAQANLP